MIKKVLNILGYSLLVTIVVCHVLLYLTHNPFYGKIGIFFFFAVGIWLLIYSLFSLKNIIYACVKNKLFLSAFLLLIWIIIIIFNVNRSNNLSEENTQEINCFIEMLKLEDKGFQKTCFLGYPVTSYLLASLPSLVFGRSLHALLAGGAIYFFMSLFIFCGGVFSYFRDQKKADLILSFILASLFHIYYFNYLLFYFEQSIFPFCLGLTLAGLLFYYLSQKEKFPLYFVGFALLLATNNYTPALSLFGLSTLCLIYLVFDIQISLQRKLKLLTILLLSLLLLFFSLKIRKDINLIETGRSNYHVYLEDSLNGFNHLLYQEAGKPFVSPYYNFIFISIIIAGLLLFRLRYFIISLWIVGTIIASIIFKGYTLYPVEFRLHRSIVIFPVIFAMIVFLFNKIKVEGKAKKLVISLVIFLAITGYIFQRNILKLREPNRHYNFISWFKNNPNFEKNFQQIGLVRMIYFSPKTYGSNYLSLNDALQYFLPNYKSREFNIDCNIQEKGSYYVLEPENKCNIQFSKNINLSFYGIYEYKEDKFLVYQSN